MAAGKVTRIPKSALTDYVLGGLGYAGSDRWHDPAMFELGIGAYRKAVGVGFDHLPFFLVYDLRMMAEHGNEYSFSDAPSASFDVSVKTEYENRVLNRLLREHCYQQALEVLAYHQVVEEAEDAVLASRVDRLTLLLLEQLAPHWPAVYSVNAAHLRDLSFGSPVGEDLAELELRWQAAVEAERDTASLLSSFVHSATGAAAGPEPIMWSRVIRPEDLFELEHLHVLDKEYLRIQARNLIEVRESIPDFDPHSIELREEESEVETLFVDQSQYPTGGFSELTTGGSFENLVLSELMYMGEAVGKGDVDLFDVRFVENELLYYTRDSGHLLRKRRTLNLVVDLRSPLNFKYPTHPYQLGTIVAGLVLTAVRDLRAIFGSDSLRFAILLLAPSGGDKDGTARKLQEVLEILLEAQIQHGRLVIEIIDRLDLASYASATRKSYAIIFSPDPASVRAWASALVALRARMPPLFGVVVDLAEGESDDLAPEPKILHLDLATSTLESLAGALFEAILAA